MIHLNNNKKNNAIITATTTIIVTVAIAVIIIAAPLASHSAWASAQGLIVERDRPVTGFSADESQFAKAPAVVSGDNVYIAWWNGTAGLPDVQTDVMFRASTDGGATFGDRINLSNSSDTDSWRVEIAGEGDTVIVSWWETNQTSDVSVARISNDAGATFGPLLMLAANGTIGVTEEEEG